VLGEEELERGEIARVFIAAELDRRPARSADFAAENRALVSLAQALGRC
jgi:hypothetical protein